jgi:hypothetical protein
MNLAPSLRQHILSSVRAGAYPHAAAEAWGVPAPSIGDRHQQTDTTEDEAAFAAEMRQAHAMARAVAETKLFANDPKLWLLHGPGRETAAAPGWTAAARPAEGSPAVSENAWLQPGLLKFLATLLDALTSFPEARRRVAQAMNAAGIDVAALSIAAETPPRRAA